MFILDLSFKSVLDLLSFEAYEAKEILLRNKHNRIIAGDSHNLLNYLMVIYIHFYLKMKYKY